MDTNNLVQPVINEVSNMAAQFGPAIASIGAIILGLVATVALWTRFGPSLVKKVFSKAS